MLPEVFNAATHFVDRNVAEGRGGHIAIECGEERVTYAQVAERVNRFGSALRRLGIQPEQRIALILQDTPAFAYSFFGAIKAGIVPVPLNTLWRAKDYVHALGDSGARVVVISEALLREFDAIDRALLPRLEHVIVVGSRSGAIHFDTLLAESSPALEAEPTHKDAMAFWLYSSGSTGGPKGCVHLQHDMFVCAESYAKGVLGMRESDRCFSAAKLFFAYGLGNALYMPFAVGATSILLPEAPTAPRVYEIIARHKPTLLFSVPTNFSMLLAHLRHDSGGQADDGDFDLSTIRYAVSAGEALPEPLFRRFKQRFGVEILDAIGSTECLHMFIANRPGHVRPGSSGQLVPGYDARIVDDHDQPVPIGEMGNLLIKGDSTCAYYWNQHEKTKATIQGDWIRTGDKYYCDADGYYWYGGRSDDMMKAGGIWVSPVEIESVLIDHEAVHECAVVGRDDGHGLLKPFAYVVLKSQIAGTPELAGALQTFVRERLAEYKRPRGVEFVSELPKTATGKLQRYKLREKRG
ncbi:MAG TPA: benzoate-CoA ligase family protein [Vicinamibacterales bacterium]|nr:benzoate-CoA ligase family protein [Vicinamibacterales bacterium]